jgi:hypothetical protein
MENGNPFRSSNASIAISLTITPTDGVIQFDTSLRLALTKTHSLAIAKSLLAVFTFTALRILATGFILGLMLKDNRYITVSRLHDVIWIRDDIQWAWFSVILN